ncbi:MAG TPA: hypothetical protein VFS37_02145 [Conexibacter sp.]|nr:hypothetical protein [Conexibacter sp.]
MDHADEDGPAISYLSLRRGTLVRGSDGVEVGRVRRVQNNAREHIFDGIVVETKEGRRFVDAPEVARIAERLVTLTVPAAEVLASAPPRSRMLERLDHMTVVRRAKRELRNR